MFRNKIIFTFLIIVLIVSVWFLMQKNIANNTATISTECSKIYEPVCGVDGVTHGNDCIAQGKGIAIAHDGVCDQASLLSELERKHLLWLLLERQKNGLTEEAIKHYYTSSDSCNNCKLYFYTWGSDIFARIYVKDDSILSAIDTTGFDYISGQQAELSHFTELDKVSNQGEFCDDRESFCASGLFCSDLSLCKTIR